jgi:hypothetical protein
MKNIARMALALLLIFAGQVTAASKDAKTITTALAKSQSQMTKIVVYTEATDPNKLLGRPGGYTSKADWADKRIKGVTGGGVDGGGTIEVYPTEKGAKQRVAYIQGLIDDGVALAIQYLYRKGAAVLRLSKELTPA